MPNLRINRNNDTSSEFYSNIDKLFKLIDVSLDKGQVKNAEKYINYFFVVMIRFYQKSSKASKITENQGFLTKATSNVDSTGSEIGRLESIFPERTIKNVFGDFFTDKIMKILTDNIKSNGYEIFHFVLNRLKDSIRILIKDAGTNDKASVLLRQFKFVVDQIHNKQNTLSSYEKAWFLADSFNWFVELYAGSVNTVDDVGILEGEMLQILKYFVDNKRVDLFEKFLERLSSTIFSFSMEKERLINTYKPKDHNLSWEYDKLIRAYRKRATELQGVFEFKEYLTDFGQDIEMKFEKFNLTQNQLEDFKTNFSKLLLDDFKECYLKIMLIKVMVYSFFKNEYSFFQKYLTYNQPSDSDAIWASKYYGIGSLNEVFYLLNNGERLILNDNLFWIGHHGFSVYLNTFLAYYLITTNEEEVVAKIRTTQDYSASVLITQELKNINLKNRINEIELVNKQYSAEIINDKFEKFIEAAEQRQNQIDYNVITESEVSTEIYETLKQGFIEHFYKSCSLRLILKTYGLLEINNLESDVNGIGINQLLPKKAFLKESDVLYFNMYDSLAGGLADSENLAILFKLESACKKITMSQKEFEDYLQKNKENFDVILSKGRYVVKSDFLNLNFTESWAMDSNLNKIPDFLGILESKLNVFYFRLPSKEGYILLNSKKLGVLKQFAPPSFKGAERVDIFNFSMIDFKNDLESLELHIGKAGDSTELLKHIWLRVFEKFQLELDIEFNGVSIELSS